ncbi:MAG: trehalose-6-phosphate synthase [Acidobacteria bacterium]|nr:trehalose-6-phosphate synthase [Acidobacteriota bacterium]
MKGGLINVSNRLPVQIRKHAGGVRLFRSSGGLATALNAAWQEQPGIWIGWPGMAQDPQIQPLLRKASRGRPYTLQAVSLTDDEVAKFYAGFANEIIWPLFHDMPTRCNFDPAYWEVYQRVNHKFAQAVQETAKAEDFVWIHDYHLMLVAENLRQAGCRSRLGFFLHIPFPAPDMFEKLPWREAILEALLRFDLLGFQTDRDRGNFEDCLRKLLPDIVVEDAGVPGQHVVRHGALRSLAGTFPISIDFDEFANHALRPEIGESVKSIRKDLNDRFLLLGVDRMDYTKGIPERLKALRIVLERFPELRRRITLVQVVVPSREEIPNYKELRHEVELLVSQINGEFTQPGWVPIHYMHRSLSREDLIAYYRAADVALITPLKDGMNLVAKEFCAAQVDERGVLILSEFAGAGPELRHGATLVNPNDTPAVATAIREACIMPLEEKQRRIRVLREIVRGHNVQRWARSFMQAAADIPQPPADQETKVEESTPSRTTPGVALVASGPRRGMSFPPAYGEPGTRALTWLARGGD